MTRSKPSLQVVCAKENLLRAETKNKLRIHPIFGVSARVKDCYNDAPNEQELVMTFAFQKRTVTLGALVTALGLLGGCASGPSNPDDPFEPFNRGVYKFNDGADKVVIKPAASVYHEIVPKPARTAVSNFFSNLDDVVVVFNDILQFKFKQAVADSARVIFNSSFGLFGFIDIMSDAGLPKHDEDFGQTLGYWGFNSGPFLMLPFFGPSSFRDGIGLFVDYRLDPIRQIDDISTRNTVIAGKVVSVRSDTLDAEKVFEEAALDPYAFLRDAYRQRRRDQVYDGNPPHEENHQGKNRIDDEEKFSSESDESQPKAQATSAEKPGDSSGQTNKEEPAKTSEVSQELKPAEKETASSARAVSINAASAQAPQVLRFWFSN